MLNNIFKKACAITAVAGCNMRAVVAISSPDIPHLFGDLTSCLAGGVTLLDQFINQDITNNKCLQYGLIIPESLLVIGACIFPTGYLKKYFEQLVKLNKYVVLLTVSVMIQAGLFKGIIDHSTPELDLAKINSIGMGDFKQYWDALKKPYVHGLIMIQAGLFKGIIDHSTPELDLAKIDSIDNIDPNSIFVDQTAEVSSELSTTTDSIQIDEGNIALEIDIVEIN